MKHIEGRLASTVVSPTYSFHPPTGTIFEGHCVENTPVFFFSSLLLILNTSVARGE